MISRKEVSARNILCFLRLDYNIKLYTFHIYFEMTSQLSLSKDLTMSVSEDLKKLMESKTFGGLSNKNDFLSESAIDVACNVVWQVTKKNPN